MYFFFFDFYDHYKTFKTWWSYLFDWRTLISVGIYSELIFKIINFYVVYAASQLKYILNLVLNYLLGY